MPVPGAKGLYGGYIKGQQDRQAFRATESKITGQDLINRNMDAEFWDYMEEADARKAEYEERKVTAKKGTSLTPDMEATERAQLKADEAKSELAEDVADSQQRLVAKQADVMDKKLDEGLRVLRKSLNTANIEELVGSAAALQEQLTNNPDADPAELYQQAHESLIYSHPDGPQRASEIYEAMGVSTQYTEKSLNQLLQLAVKADHNLATRRAEHLTSQEWRLRIEEARIDATAKGATPKDRTHKRATTSEKAHLGVRVRSIMKELWDDLEGNYNTANDKWTDAKGEVVEAIADISRSYQSTQKIGGDVNPEEVEFVLADFIRELPKEYIDDDSIAFGFGSSNKFKGYEFELQANALLTMLGNTRATWSDRTGKPVSLIDVWSIRKPFYVNHFSSQDE